MTTIQWWRSWHGAPMDAKWPVISARSGVKVGIVSAIFWELCDFASQNKERGSIEGFDVEVYSVYSGFSEDEINAVIKALNDKEIIQDNRLVNWVKRQPQREDDSYDRVTKFRELKRNVTQCNAEISSDSDTDKDSDKDKESQPLKNNYLLYTEEIGLLTPSISDFIDLYEKELTENWVHDAILEASKHSARTMAYVKKVLDTWKANGRKSDNPQRKKSNGDITQDIIALAKERHGLNG